MKILYRILFFSIFVAVLFNFMGCSSLNDFQDEGTLVLAGLTAPVKVLRDENGMPYIYAENLHDAIMAQGYVTAQDRLFPMELTKLFATGRISELAGEKAKNVDIKMRTIGFHRNAEKHAKQLDKRTLAFLQAYIDGVNTYIRTREETRPVEFKLAGIEPGEWTISDSMSILYYMAWNSAANIKTEVIAQMLIEKVGIEKARGIFPLNINPDDSKPDNTAFLLKTAHAGAFDLTADKMLLSLIDDAPLHLGSNNWVTDGAHSAGGKPIVANDPHLNATILPGPWYPSGIITPEIRAVGVGIPGIPGVVIGRTRHIALGMTNAYGDTQDLYVETVDPDNPANYLEGEKSIPFEVIAETLNIKDKDAAEGVRKEKIKIRLTRRGPVVSSVLGGLETNRVMTLRWAPFESMGPSIGIDKILMAESVSDVRRILGEFSIIALNFVFADTGGGIGWQTSGKLPIRTQGDGTIPYTVSGGTDNWEGWVPYEDMPGDYNPQKGWLGTCNHKTVTSDTPYYYSSHVSPSYRYRRLKELMRQPGKKTAEDHWRFQLDTMNLMAKKIAPVMAEALLADKTTRAMGEILSKWDFHDDVEKAGPAIFQSVYQRFAFLVFSDELGETVTRTMLGNWYFWQERLQKMVLEGVSPWFDNQSSKDKKETPADLFRAAALDVMVTVGADLGKNPEKWQWGQLHRHEFVSPIRRSGFGKGWVGGGAHPARGSGETLCRGLYDYNKSFDVTVSASLRMVADLSDDEKILAVLPGGVAGRLFHPHTKDQVEPFMTGDKLYWWFSDATIQKHCQKTLTLAPK